MSADEEIPPQPPGMSSSDDDVRFGPPRSAEVPRRADPVALTLSADPASAAPAGGLQSRSPVPVPVRDPDRYEVLGEHGRGGLGVVSRAHDKELGRDIAIKELLARGPLQERRFVREAMITARLEHPGIVPVHEAGRWPDGTPFYAMKLVSGRPLRALIAERKTVDERIGLLHHVIVVADAIAYAHGRKIIHRDLKPANVIVGDFGETVVIDWGLAKDLSDAVDSIAGGESARSSDEQLTSVGSVLGTPAYMAPEQERGEAVDQRADVFAIGAMLWELCSLQKVPPVDLVQRHRLLQHAGIDHDLAVIIDKAIDPDPRGRYPDAGALAADLRAFKSGARITARSYSLPAMLMHWTRRHRALAISAVAFVALVLVSVAALAVLYRSSSTNAEIAHRNERAASRNAATADERLVQSYVERGRRALLDGKYHEALPFLIEAVHHGGDSPMVRFMLSRAAEPVGEEVLRIQSATPRMWQAKFSCDGQRLLTSDDMSAQISDARTGERLFTLPHTGPVLQAQYGPGCRRVVTFGMDGFVKIWEAATGTLVRSLTTADPGDSSAYLSGELSADGRLIAVMSTEPSTTRIWDAETGVLLTTFVAGSGDDHTVVISHDSRWLAATVGDEVQIFDTRTWRSARRLPIRNVISLAFDPAGDRLMTGTSLGDISIWDLPSLNRIRHLREFGDPITLVTFSTDGQQLAAFERGGRQMVWRAGSSRLHAFTSHDRRVSASEFDHSGKLLLSAGIGGRVVATDVDSARPIMMLRTSGNVSDAHFDPSGQHVVAASLDGAARVWPVRSPYLRWSSAGIGRDCETDVSLDLDRRFLAVGCMDHETRVWDTASDTLLATLPSMGRSVRFTDSVWPAVSSDGELAAVARGDVVDVYALPGGRVVRSIQHAAPITTLRFAARGHALVTGSKDGALRVTPDVQSAEVGMPVMSAVVEAAALLPDGRLVAVDVARRLTVFDIERRARVASVIVPTRIEALRISADGKRMLAMPILGKNTPPTLWDLESLTLVAPLEGHQGQVYSARFVGDGHDLLTAGTDGTARRWDARTGRLRQTFLGPILLFDATLSPDGAMVVGAEADGNVRFWDAVSGAELWSFRAHKAFISGLHFEGDALITRAGMGDLARWELPKPTAVGSSVERFERLVRCGPMRFDGATGTLVTQFPSCHGPQQSPEAAQAPM